MNAQPILKYTAEEYLELEETSLEKNEFYKGEIFAKIADSTIHNQIVSNTNIEIAHFLKNKKCQILTSDFRIYCIKNSFYTYPDLSIFCNDIERIGKGINTVTNPTVLIEVLSKTTEIYDHGAKFKLYRDIPSLKEYILISSLETLIEKYNKQADGSWVLHEYKNEADSFTITTIDLIISVKDLYRNVVFES